MFSRARFTSARASGSDLPISRLTSRASSSAPRRIRSANRNKRSQRRETGVALQAGKASQAAAIARSASPAVESGTRAITSPVLGSSTSRSPRLSGAIHSPPT